MIAKPTPPSRHILAFKTHLERASASPHTVRAYLRDLAEFEGYLASGGVDLLDATHPVIRGYLGRLAASLAPSSRARKLASIKALFRFLTREGTIDANPAR